MKNFLLLDGSPRGERSNTWRMLSHLAEGWREAGGEAPQVLHLARPAEFEQALAGYAEADVVLLGMPLYTDAMPALVLRWIERLGELERSARPLTFGFLVQSGFPEAAHCRMLERYLHKLTRRLGAREAGVLVRGGGEALQMLPDKACRKLWEQLRTLGQELALSGEFAPDSLRRLAGTERYTGLRSLLARLLLRLPWINFYWNMQLKKNGAWGKRFDAPYQSVIE